MSTILGSGVDVVGVARVERAVARHGEEFLREFLRPSEIDRFRGSRSPLSSCAAAFAAKEAFFKALGAGRAGTLSWLDIEVMGTPGGRTVLRTAGASRRALEDRGAARVHLSLGVTAGIAFAWVLLEGG